MDHLEKEMEKLSVNNSMSNNNIYTYIDYDIHMIIYCIEYHYPSIIPFIHSETCRNKNEIIAAFQNDESIFYRHLVEKLNLNVKRIDVYDIMPLIDEYIEFIFHV